MRSTTPESAVLRACLQYLELRGVVCWRNNSGAARIGGAGGRKRFVRFGAVGSADILGCLGPSGRLLAVEVKRPGGKPTAAQAAFLGRVRDAGGVAVVVSDVRQLEAVLAGAGVP